MRATLKSLYTPFPLKSIVLPIAIHFILVHQIPFLRRQLPRFPARCLGLCFTRRLRVYRTLIILINLQSIKLAQDWPELLLSGPCAQRRLLC